MVIEVINEIGYDMSGHSSKGLDDYLGRTHFGIVITVCDKVEERCSMIFGVSTRLFWPFDDPYEFTGTDEEKLSKFRIVMDRSVEDRGVGGKNSINAKEMGL